MFVDARKSRPRVKAAGIAGLIVRPLPCRVTVKQESTPDGVVAQLQISSAEASDSGAYFCQASNLYGRDQQLVQLLVQGSCG